MSLSSFISRYRNAWRAALFSSAVGALALASSAPALAQTRIVFGPSGGLSDNSLAVQVAIDEGFYKEAGLYPEVVAFRGGGPALQALTSGSIQFCVCAPEHIVRLRARGIDVVSAYALNDRTPYVLFSGPDSQITRLDDLRGHKIGITTAGSLTDNLVRLALKRAGIQPDRDVEIVSLGAGIAHKAGIDTGNVAAGMLAGFDALSLQEAGYHRIVDWRNEDVPALALIATQTFVDENPAAVQAVASATLRATKLLLENRDVRVAALRKLFPDVPQALIERGADHLQTALNKDGRFQEAAFRRLEADLIELEPELVPVDFEAANPVFLR